MLGWLRDLFDRRPYVVRYDFTQSGIHMTGTLRISPRCKTRADRIAKWMCDIYGSGTHWPEAA